MIKTRINSFLESPSLNGWGFLLGLISLFFAFYTYFDSQISPNLIAVVQPLKTNIVSNANVESIQLSVNGKRLNGPLTAIQIVIWNDGSKPIRYDDVLEPLIIKSDKNVTIVSSKIIKQTRKVNNLSVSNNQKEVNVKFNILEKNDGAIIQLIYEGDDKVKFMGSAVIVGQRNFSVEDTSLETKYFFETDEDKQRQKSSIGNSLVLLGILLQSLIVLNWIRVSILRLRTTYKSNYRVSIDVYKILLEVFIYLVCLAFVIYVGLPIYLEMLHVPPATLIA